MTVTIETPFPEADYPLLYQWVRASWRQVASDETPDTLGEFVDLCRQQSSRTIRWAVYRDGELGGCIEYVPVAENMGFGHAVFSRDFWGRETTVNAINQGLMHLFTIGVKLVLFQPFAHNRLNLAMLKSIGAVEIGPLIGAFTQHGVLIDGLLLGLTADGWTKANADFILSQSQRAAAIAGNGG